MKQLSLSQQYHDLMCKLSALPKKILLHHGNDHIAQFVMHELCSDSLMNITRAAYLVDNPDFDCLQGISGFCKKEVNEARKDIWDNPQEFEQSVNASPFNTLVRSIKQQSVKKNKIADEKVVKNIAHTLDIPNPGYYAWDMKHGNHGIFVFQKSDVPEKAIDYLSDSVCLLGFCPII